MNVSSGLQLQVTDALLVGGCVGLVAVAGALGVRAWRRSGARPSVLVVEVIPKRGVWPWSALATFPTSRKIYDWDGWRAIASILSCETCN